MVDSHRSELEKDKKKLEAYIAAIEQAIGYDTKVTGILEIGSFAKDEGTKLSDVDTRIYVESEDFYIWNVDGHKSSESIYSKYKDRLKVFIQKYGKKPIINLTWTEFNEPTWERLWTVLDMQVEFGLVDRRYAEFELDNLDHLPSNEHSFLMQSNIIYDPHGFLTDKRQVLEGKVLPTMVRFYSEHFLSKLPSRLYESIDMDEKDLANIAKINKIQWVKRAVRCVREAVTAKLYMSSGQIVYKKEDVLAFYKKYLPEEYDFVIMLYNWKTCSEIRKNMIQKCLRNPKALSREFKRLMPQLEATIKAVKNLEISK